MQADDARFLKRKVKGGSVDVHPTEKALVVNYELEATILGETGDPMIGERKQCSKIIKVKSLTESTNVNALSKEIISRCKLIHPSKQPEVEQLLYYLQKRKQNLPNKDDNASGDHLNEPTFEGTEIDEVANLNELDEYVDLLYEEKQDKVRGTALILQLARNPDNLEELLQNETVLSALSRVLREDWKKSTELAINIIYIFFCFSAFTNFHGVVQHFKVGALCMEVIEHELKKHSQWIEELSRKKKLTVEKPKKESLRRDYDISSQNYTLFKRKQDQLLRVSYYLLLNISEQQATEVKMRNKGVVRLLVNSLSRDNSELLILVVSFLKKLSVYVENKNEMAELNIIEKLCKLISNKHDDLLNVVLRLFLNLSFDRNLCRKFITVGLFPRFVDLLLVEQHRLVTLCILYHISVDERNIPIFAQAECVPLLLKMAMECQQEKVDIELVAIIINLATNEQLAKKLIDGKGLKLLLRRTFKFKDALLLKVVRNISHHSPLKAKFLDYVADLATKIKNNQNEDFMLECIGILGNLTLEDLDYAMIMQEFKLMPFIIAKIEPGRVEDDILLEIVILIGTMARDEECAQIMARENVIQTLIELLNVKQEDDDIVCQTIYVFYQLIFHKSTREIIVKETQAPAYLIDLMHDKNPEIRKVCDLTLDIMSEFDEELCRKIKMEKFRWHNSQWLEMVETHQMEDSDMAFYNDDNYGPFVQDAELLQQPELYYDVDESGFAYNGVPFDRSSPPIDGYNAPMPATDEYGRPLMYPGNHPSNASFEDTFSDDNDSVEGQYNDYYHY